jgi:hypothetical protein
MQMGLSRFAAGYYYAVLLLMKVSGLSPCRNSERKHNQVRDPYQTNYRARMRMIRERKRDPHEDGHGNHDAKLLPYRHPAPTIPRDSHRFFVDTRLTQPSVETA